jgi:hypothetical protein
VTARQPYRSFEKYRRRRRCALARLYDTIRYILEAGRRVLIVWATHFIRTRAYLTSDIEGLDKDSDEYLRAWILASVYPSIFLSIDGILHLHDGWVHGGE